MLSPLLPRGARVVRLLRRTRWSNDAATVRRVAQALRDWDTGHDGPRVPPYVP